MSLLSIEMNEDVAWVWLNRPDRLNALSPEMLDELGACFEDLGRDESVRAVVLGGKGRAFSAGLDVRWMARATSEEVASKLEVIEGVFDGIEACPKPVIGCVDGTCLGGGLLLALVSDLRVASPRASFGAPEVKIGILANLHFIPRLERLVGLGAAKMMLLTGETISAEEAHRTRLVDRLVPAEELLSETGKLARQLAQLSPTALSATKAAFSATQRSGYDEWEREQFLKCWSSPERAAAMGAFLKR